MEITIYVEDGGSPQKSIVIDAEGSETIEMVAVKAARELGIDPAELMDDLGTDELSFAKHDTVDNCIRHGHKWQHRRVCVQVHYQSEDAARHVFNPQRPWRVVHEWGCMHFHVAQVMCQDLELFEGSPTGRPLNENSPIGFSRECKVVWLAKPGPEPNG